MLHCWRPENHENGDRTPSVGLHFRKNRVKCFVCDAHALSPIDLVMHVRGVELPRAVAWITSRWPVPDLPHGKHVQHGERWPERFRLGTGTSAFEPLIRSGIWSDLAPSDRAILPVLETFALANSRQVTISYRGISRYSGIRSPTTVSLSLKRLRALRILSITNTRGNDGFRTCNTYRITLDDPQFLQLAQRAYEAHLEAIAQEKALRKIARSERKAVVPAKRRLA